MEAMVYVNHGRVLVDCPTGCGNAYLVSYGETSRVCDAPSSGCGVFFSLDTDNNLSDVVQELNKRVNPKNRNWFPENHPLAVRANIPHGQTVLELEEERVVNDGVDNPNDSSG